MMSVEQVAKRCRNQNQILRALHFEGPLQRSELSRRCGIRKNSVTSIADELLEREIVVEDNPDNARSRLYLEAKKYHVVCAAIKADEILFGRVFLDGRLEHTHRMRIPGAAKQILAALATRLREEISVAERWVLGVGVAARGIVDPVKGIGVFAAHLRDWRDVPIKSFLDEQLHCGVYVDNDARCQLWAHAWFGRLLKSYSNIMYLAFTEGVGSASIVHNKILVGTTHSAGEIGHVRVGDEQRQCRCGEMDCLETYAGLNALSDEIQRRFPDIRIRSALDVARAARQNPEIDKIVDAAVARCARVLSCTWTSLDPDVLVVGSHDSEFSHLLRSKLIPHLHAYGCRRLHDTQVLAAESEDDTMLCGIAGLVIENGFLHNRLSLRPHKTERLINV